MRVIVLIIPFTGVDPCESGVSLGFVKCSAAVAGVEEFASDGLWVSFNTMNNSVPFFTERVVGTFGQKSNFLLNPTSTTPCIVAEFFPLSSTLLPGACWKLLNL